MICVCDYGILWGHHQYFEVLWKQIENSKTQNDFSQQLFSVHHFELYKFTHRMLSVNTKYRKKGQMAAAFFSSTANQTVRKSALQRPTRPNFIVNRNP